MCDQTFQELSDEAFRLVRDTTIVEKKKKEFTHVGEEVKALKQQIDTRITARSISHRLAASQR
jgi:SepF-like predicted cell division protein (DUF552 family)